MTDDLILNVGGQNISGWTDIAVTRGIECLPSHFNIGITEKYPNNVTQVSVSPGNMCKVFLGKDLVITGYVDRYMPSYGPNDHTVRVTGRGKCQDLVDCSAEYPNNEIANVTALALAQKLASPYGITVTALAAAATDTIISKYDLMWGETAYDVLERACRYVQLLAYDGTDGNLILAQVGTATAASGLTEGQNVRSASAVFSADQRYSDYVVRLMSISSLLELGNGGDILETLNDKGVGRHRLRYIIAENGGNYINVAKARGIWEMNRRLGRSQQVRVTTDSWRDSAGALWTPNSLVPLSLPSLKITNQNWLIGEVTYRLYAGGTSADLTLMPPTAFQPQPIALIPYLPELLPQAGAQ